MQVTLGSILVIFIGFAYLSNLWSQDYLAQVDYLWGMSPIEDVKIVNASDGKCPTGY
jgi:hypothetical protein